MGNSNEPDPITWATSPPDPSYIAVPGAGDQANGFDPLQLVPHSWINWAWNRFASWVNYLSSFMGANSDGFVISGFEVTEVPNATQVNVAVGVAIAGGREVESTVAEVITVTNPAGLGSVSNPRVYTLTIDSTGLISTSTSTTDGVGIEETLAIAKVYARANLQPGEAVLAYLVDQGQATWDAANIYNDKQDGPISSAVVATASIESQSLRSSVLYPRFDTVDTSTAQRVELPLELANFDKVGSFGIFADGNFRPGNITLWVRVRDTDTTSSTALGPDGYAFTAVTAYAGTDVGIAVRRAADVAGLGGISCAPWTADMGGTGYWQGLVDPIDANDANDGKDFVIEFHRNASQPAKTVLVEVGSNHGVTSATVITLPAT